MKITLIDAGKRFNRDWIFRHLDYEFSTGHSYAITGPNGSGKSTLLQSVAGAIGISQGRIEYRNTTPGKPAGKASSGATLFDDIPSDQAFRYLSLAAPYLQPIEEMTVTEFLHFHAAFKPLLPGSSINGIIRTVGLEAAAHKQIRYYSSGMKQRVRLAQALFSDTPVILLDEPCTNLDSDGIELYQQLIREYAAGRLVIVSSNDLQEYEFCEERINIMGYK
ncbi:MAG TPA: ATP-binding cassette domain-containing protein [Puia sp.]|nr:ATP-binding cassette domain-containing protein [Puia sp.]